ncbi:MAG TPA: hydrogenase formation protein HypD [Polyangia bacterium]
MAARDPQERFRDPALVARLVASLAARAPGRPLRFMHVCGTHENFIGQYGIRDLLPPWLKIIAGPGCPVCVCPAAEIDLAARLALERGVVLATFGDVLRVPARLSLAAAKAQGADVRIVYSPADAVALAVKEPRQEVVFFAVGFETTACTVASVLALAPPPNFSIVCSHRLIPPALAALLAVDGPGLAGYLLPGHVMAVMGTREYEVFPTRHAMPLAVAGFEPVDILLALDHLVGQVVDGTPALFNGYPRAVRPEGNVVARQRIDEVFEACDAPWRGIGTIPRSGLRLRPAYRDRDATARFGLAPDPAIPDIEPGCSCHLIMLGAREPDECGLFGTRCTPESPVGPCMVSMEGTCRAWYRHGRGRT